jgi:hypothetical protein
MINQRSIAKYLEENSSSLGEVTHNQSPVWNEGNHKTPHSANVSTEIRNRSLTIISLLLPNGYAQIRITGYKYPWNWALGEKVEIAGLLKKFKILWNSKFLTMLRTAHPSSLHPKATSKT